MSQYESYALSVLRSLEAESIHIIREVVAECERPVLMYSVGKDSSVLVRLAQKAFFPGRIPFPLLHIDTSYKFPEIYAFRDEYCRNIGADLRVHSNRESLTADAKSWGLGTVKCCGVLKTQGLLQALKTGRYDAVIGGARRDEERSRATEHIYSFRDIHHLWDPERQRPELWTLYNGRLNAGESMHVYPLSNWTELDIWQYIEVENIPVVPLYFAKPREMVVRNGQLLPIGAKTRLLPGETLQTVMSRYRTLGCYPCTGAVASEATSVNEIIEELKASRRSERAMRVMDHDQDGSMEHKKREGYI